MCELFGLSSKEKVRTTALLTEFFSHAKDNPHGWGAAVFGGGKAEVVKEPVPAAESSAAKAFAGKHRDACLLLAHIRYATKGAVSSENTHPFVMKDIGGEEWVLAHNGTIFGCEALSGYIHDQQGETDSERILLYLIESLNMRMREKGESLTNEEKAEVVRKVLMEITPGNKVNLLISDGKLLFVHTNYRGSLMYIMTDGAVTISSKPLWAALPETWEEVPLNTLMAFEKGRLIYRGEPHDNEYFEDEERTRMLFLDYANM